METPKLNGHADESWIQPRRTWRHRSVVPGGQGVRHEAESEGHEEKYRAVIEGRHPEDELVGRGWGKVEPAIGRRRRSHSPIRNKVIAAARYGRIARDLAKTGGAFGWHRG
jgi:hypothetical protein